MAALAISTRHIVHEPTAPDLPFREEHFGYRFNDVSVPPEHAGIVLVDCWDIHITASHVERTGQICRERIRPVLDACREIGVTVIHAPSPNVAHKFPQWLRYAGDSELSPQPQAAPAWPPEDFAKRRGEWAHLRVDRTDTWAAEIDQINEDRYIDASVFPEPDDFVIANGQQLHRLCAHRKLLFLFYVGFATNLCVPHRDYGMLAMRDRGYGLILLRDCTTGIETSETIDGLLCTNVAIHDYELRDIAGTITSAEFLSAAQALQTGAAVSVEAD